jgi:hypothetical protein
MEFRNPKRRQPTLESFGIRALDLLQISIFAFRISLGDVTPGAGGLQESKARHHLLGSDGRGLATMASFVGDYSQSQDIAGVLVQRSFRALLFSAPNFRRSHVIEQECVQKSVDKHTGLLDWFFASAANVLNADIIKHQNSGEVTTSIQ